MRGLRRHLRLLAVLWIVTQTAMVSAFVPLCCCAPVSHRSTVEAPSCHEDVPAAACPMRTADGAACPMHSGKTSGRTPAQTMRSCCDPGLEALAAFLGDGGVLGSAPDLLTVLDLSAPVASAGAAFPRWLARVESPPPRS